jgi:TorA maturation chaperone TorD
MRDTPPAEQSPADIDDRRDSMVEAAVARADMYRFLSSVYLSPPRDEVLQQLLDREFLDELAVLIGEDAVAELRSFLEANDVDQESGTLDTEFMDLFAVPTGRYVAPFEDVYWKADSGGPLLGEQAVAVVRTYREAGAQIDHEIKELPTHVGVELAFMTYLCEAEAVAAIDGDGAQPDHDDGRDRNWYRGLQRQFLEEHLIPWFPRLRSKIQAKANGPLYRGLATITEEFLSLDAAGFG